MSDNDFPLLGAHTSTSGGLFNAIEEGKEIKADVLQIFSKNQRQWIGRDYKKGEVEQFHQAIEDSGIRPVMIHTSYLINLASTNEATLKNSLEAMVDELHRCHLLKIPYVVLHPGSHLNAGEEAGIQKIAQNLNKVVNKADVDDVIILLETTAGQGTNLGYTFEQLREMMDQSKVDKHLGVCMDTCHIFTAGYDIRTPQAWQKTKQSFDNVIGLHKLKGLHLNDSQKDLGSKVDRHDRIGKGLLGIEPFQIILNDPDMRGLPMILEVPGGPKAYKQDLKILRGCLTNKFIRIRSNKNEQL
jgi:deoxyribonuclease-4